MGWQACGTWLKTDFSTASEILIRFALISFVGCGKIKLFKKIMPEFIDDRGAITKILDDGKTIIKSILLITCKKGAIRANHYHQKDSHYCYLISGRMDYLEEPVGQPDKRQAALVEAGDMIYTPPMAVHAMHFTEESVFIAFATESRAQENYEADTVRVKLI